MEEIDIIKAKTDLLIIGGGVAGLQESGVGKRSLIELF